MNQPRCAASATSFRLLKAGRGSRKLTLAVLSAGLAFVCPHARANTASASNSGEINTTGSAGSTYIDIAGSNAGPGSGNGNESFDVLDFTSASFGFSNPNVAGIQGDQITLNLTESNFGSSAAGPIEFYLTTNTSVGIASGSTALTYQNSTANATTNTPYGIDPTLGALPGSSGSNSNVLYDLGSATYPKSATNYTMDTFTLTISNAAASALVSELDGSGGDVRLVVAASSPSDVCVLFGRRHQLQWDDPHAR